MQGLATKPSTKTGEAKSPVQATSGPGEDIVQLKHKQARHWDTKRTWNRWARRKGSHPNLISHKVRVVAEELHDPQGLRLGVARPMLKSCKTLSEGRRGNVMRGQHPVSMVCQKTLLLLLDIWQSLSPVLKGVHRQRNETNHDLLQTSQPHNFTQLSVVPQLHQRVCSKKQKPAHNTQYEKTAWPSSQVFLLGLLAPPCRQIENAGILNGPKTSHSTRRYTTE